MQVNLRPTLVINSISSISAWSLNKCITYDPHRVSHAPYRMHVYKSCSGSANVLYHRDVVTERPDGEIRHGARSVGVRLQQRVSNCGGC